MDIHWLHVLNDIENNNMYFMQNSFFNYIIKNKILKNN